MVEWFKILKKGFKSQKKEIAELWIKCDNCNEVLYKEVLEKNLWVCPHCNNHFKVEADFYRAIIADEGTFHEYDVTMESKDFLSFKDKKRYSERLKEYKTKTGKNEAILTGTCKINGTEVVVAIMNFGFMGGSMGSVVGEKIARAIKYAISGKKPLIIFSASGGARMQESIYSLMQMAKTSAWLAKLSEKKLPFISVLTNPTTGGVTASFASLGDVNIAEPNALIGFAGPRVIRETIKQELPQGFQKSEFMLDHGFVDCIVSRKDLKSTISKFIVFFNNGKSFDSAAS